MNSPRESARPPLNPGLKLVLELGPLMVFFLANNKPDWFRPLLARFLSPELISGERGGIFTATAAFMIAMLISLGLMWHLARTLPVMPVVSGIVVLVFGGLTLYLQDDLFIKLKPTIVNSLFGAALLGGLAFGKPLLPYVLDSVFKLNAEGWKKLTFRWGIFFFILAALNEIVWRTQTTDFWVGFKVWAVMPLTMIFAMAQIGLINRHAAAEDRGGE